MLHILKTVDPHFEEQWEGRKLFEVRRKDRNYQVGDYILSRHYNAKDDSYSGRQILFRVPYIMEKPLFEAIIGMFGSYLFVIMSTEMLWKTTLTEGQAAVDLARETINEREGVLK